MPDTFRFIPKVPALTAAEVDMTESF